LYLVSVTQNPSPIPSTMGKELPQNKRNDDVFWIISSESSQTQNEPELDSKVLKFHLATPYQLPGESKPTWLTFHACGKIVFIFTGCNKIVSQDEQEAL
jgi:hypothetical protein